MADEKLSDELRAEALRIADDYGMPPSSVQHLVKRILALCAKVQAEAREAGLEEAARLHESVRVDCDHERNAGHPGAAAMGAVIEYRDAIRALKAKR